MPHRRAIGGGRVGVAGKTVVRTRHQDLILDVLAAAQPIPTRLIGPNYKHLVRRDLHARRFGLSLDRLVEKPVELGTRTLLGRRRVNRRRNGTPYRLPKGTPASSCIGSARVGPGLSI